METCVQHMTSWVWGSLTFWVRGLSAWGQMSSEWSLEVDDGHTMLGVWACGFDSEFSRTDFCMIDYKGDLTLSEQMLWLWEIPQWIIWRLPIYCLWQNRAFICSGFISRWLTSTNIFFYVKTSWAVYKWEDRNWEDLDIRWLCKRCQHLGIIK